MSLIWKFDLDPFSETVKMPVGARVIHVHEQNGKLRLWAEVDENAHQEDRYFAVIPTGGVCPDGRWEYLDSAHFEEDGLMIVLHVYEFADGQPVRTLRASRDLGADWKETIKH